MTVPPLFGWEHILIALAIIVLAAVAGLVLLAAGRGASARKEWQAWLDGRSAQRRDHAPVVADDAAFVEEGPRGDSHMRTRSP